MSKAAEEHRELVALRKAIRARCLLCSGNLREADRCRVLDCPLRPFRPRIRLKRPKSGGQEHQISMMDMLGKEAFHGGHQRTEPDQHQ